MIKYLFAAVNFPGVAMNKDRIACYGRITKNIEGATVIGKYQQQAAAGGKQLLDRTEMPDQIDLMFEGVRAENDVEPKLGRDQVFYRRAIRDKIDILDPVCQVADVLIAGILCPEFVRRGMVKMKDIREPILCEMRVIAGADLEDRCLLVNAGKDWANVKQMD
jgi:hypothetical protein